MSEFTSKSGAKILINPAPWKDASELKNVVVTVSIPLEKISFNEQNIKSFLKKFIVLIDSTPRFQAAIWPCLIRCTRNDKKIEHSTFDPLDAREDYFDIVEACTELNLGPLLERIFSPFIAQAVPGTISSESAPA